MAPVGDIIGQRKGNISAPVVAKEATRRRGCYSITYIDSNDYDSMFAMDYDWRIYPENKNTWTCSESPLGRIYWSTLQKIPHAGYQAILDHFGLAEHELDMSILLIMSPAELVRLRRAKEERYGLKRMVMRNMRLGYTSEEEFADNFEVQA